MTMATNAWASRPRRRRSKLLIGTTTLCLLFVHGAGAATALADQPLFTNVSVPGNLALTLSVEYPTAVSVAHISSYTSNSTYLGYFDPNKCYLYNYDPTTETNRYFYPAGAAASRVCTGADDSKWSGNFLNWATTQTIDPFRWALTGGYRVTDTTTTTIIEKAWASGQGGTGNFPDQTVSSGGDVQKATPFNKSSFKMRIQGLGNKMRFTFNGDPESPTVITYDPTATLDDLTVYELSVRVKVCDPSTSAGGLEANCKQYGSNYKPEGLLQQYSDRMRYSAFGYLNDSNIQRDGGVLRARQKFIAPTQPVPGRPAITNSKREWDPSTGVFVTNPDTTDASDTGTLFGVAVNNSGVMNYLNKFGASGSYKTYDPVSELYYAAVRYLKAQGNVAAWTNIPAGTSNVTTASWVDGFPVITTWDDPIQYSCQRNFILGIGDVNTHADANVPGIGTPTGNESTKPSEVVADTTVDAVVATNKVGSLEGLGSSLGTIDTYNGCCNNNTALIAGLAYDSHTKDIRPDDSTKPNTLGMQTIDTYWLDVLEFSTYKNNNQYYLAAKYGGFTVPSGFNPYTQTTALPQTWWSTSGDVLGSPSQSRPDNYFVASSPDTMVNGLTKAFANIAAALKAYTTSSSTTLPQVATGGNASYASQFDSSNWTGEIVASSLSFDPVTGDPSQTVAWKFTDKIAVQVSGTGWDTGRRIVTWNPSTSAAVAFRTGSLATSQVTALDTTYRTGDDSADFVNYLRGNQLHEQASTDPASSKAYRTRAKLLGDVVGSRVRPVGPPSLIFSDATNAGYSSFKSTWASRATVLYFGSNDGMLHAVNGALSGTSAGNEIFAYVPSPAIPGPTGTPATNGIQTRGNPSFVHYNYVNATPTIYDIDLGKTDGGTGTNWRSVLIGGLGKGGKSYYAIDVTDPSAFSTETATAGKVLWEFSDADMGYTYGEPVVMKTKRWGWVAVFVSGFNNADGKGYFFVVNPRTGALLQKISTGAGSTTGDAGMAFVNAYVPDRTDGTGDAVYAGDLLGNLWRLDVTSPRFDYPAPTKITVLTDASGNAQPVTTRPLIEVQPNTNRRFVLVGSGRLLDTTDIASTMPQSYYAIRDGSNSKFSDSTTLPSGVTFPIGRSNLLANSDPVVGVTFNSPTQMGWYIDLGTGTGGIGWRVLTDSDAFYGVVAFASTLPGGDACSPSGQSRVYAIDFGTGKSVLTTSTTSSGTTTTNRIAYSSVLTNVVTDVKFFSVNGKARLIGGTDTGSLKSIPGIFGASTGLRRLNWRELPTAD